MSNQDKQFSTALSRINDSFMPMIIAQFEGNNINMEDYQKQCVLSAIGGINAVLSAKLIDWNDKQLDKSNITDILMDVARLKLNASAHPREVYFKLHNKKFTGKDENGKSITVWKKQIEMEIEGDGNDSILANFGRDVAKVLQFWLVRENDPWEYPRFNGLEMTPPQWTQTGKGKVVRVVYPIVKKDGLIEFYIGERDDVVKNLMAHINNNLMNETFGICKDRFDATPEQLKEIATKKKAILKQANDLGLDALDDPDLQDWMSPAWTEYHSRESMLIRKMRNNVVKKIPKDFGSGFIEFAYDRRTDGVFAAIEEEIQDNANTTPIDVEHRVIDSEPETEQKQPPASPENTDSGPNTSENNPPTAGDQPLTDSPPPSQKETGRPDWVEDD